MKIKELIELLESIEDKNTPVVLEGCDCYGEWNGKGEVVPDEKKFYKYTQYLLLTRD